MTQLAGEASLAELEVWISAYADATQTITASAVAEALESWVAFKFWYDDAKVVALSTAIAALSAGAQQQTAGAAAQYAVGVATALGIVQTGAGIPSVPTSVIRNGAPPALVHSRPAEAYRRAVALGATHQEALERAGLRARGVMGSDLTLQQRQAEQLVLAQAGVTAYRRVIRPEMSKTGTCGLCIAASDRVYTTGELMPIHPPSCNCIAMAIVGDPGGPGDPGLIFNRHDIGQLYADAGSTKAADLARTRYQVNTHGEYGPVLTREQDTFRGPDRVALEDDAARAGRLLAKAAPVLELMRGGDWDGEDPDAARAYQEQFVDRLSGIAAAA